LRPIRVTDAPPLKAEFSVRVLETTGASNENSATDVPVAPPNTARAITAPAPPGVSPHATVETDVHVVVPQVPVPYEIDGVGEYAPKLSPEIVTEMTPDPTPL
jgi:hypothetical protein